jgi:hypothetical protein
MPTPTLPLQAVKSFTAIHLEQLVMCLPWHEDSKGSVMDVASMNNPVCLLLSFVHLQQLP